MKADVIQAFLDLDSGLCQRLVNLMNNDVRCSFDRHAALSAAAAILSGNDDQTQMMINCSVLKKIPCILKCNDLKQQACWALYNITRGNRSQVQAVVDADCLGEVTDCLYESEPSVIKEALRVIRNITGGTRATADHIKYVVHVTSFQSLCSILTLTLPSTVTDPSAYSQDLVEVKILALKIVTDIIDCREQEAKLYIGFMTLSPCFLETITALRGDENDEVSTLAAAVTKKIQREKKLPQDSLELADN